MYKPSRAQLAKFLPDPETVRAFEALFNLAAGDDGAIAALQSAMDTLTNRVTIAESDIADGAINDAVEHARMNVVATLLSGLAGKVEALEVAPVSAQSPLVASGGGNSYNPSGW